MNDINPVPARIVIVGTSTMKLSDRFTQICEENSRRSDNKNFFGGLASDNMISRSFLYDNYMSNELFGSNKPRYQNIGNDSRAQNGLIYNNDFEADEILYNQHDNRFFSKPMKNSFNVSPLRRYKNGFNNSRRSISRNNKRLNQNKINNNFDEFYKPVLRPRLSIKNRISVPIQKRITFNKMRNRFTFIRNKFFSQGKSRNSFKQASIFNRKTFTKVRRRGLQNNPQENVKKTVEELNQELDSYMNGFKHPRIEIFDKMSDARLLKEMQIKTNVLKRYVKEYYFYEKEVQKHIEKINALKADASVDEYTIKKLNEVLQETKGMVPISVSNVKKSALDLKQHINDNFETLSKLDTLVTAQDVIVLADSIR